MQGNWPLISDLTGRKLNLLLGQNHDHDFTKMNNFNKKGYLPVNGNQKRLAIHVNVDAWPMGKEHEMPEQHSKSGPLSAKFYTHFFDTGSKLQDAGISHKWWDQKNLKHNGVTEVLGWQIDRKPPLRFDLTACCLISLNQGLF